MPMQNMLEHFDYNRCETNWCIITRIMLVIALVYWNKFPETQSKGRVPDDRDLLNKQHGGIEMKSAAFFSRNKVILSGPQALLTFKLDSSA